MITMSDIAQRAGVSRPAVSFVLNDKYQDIGISEETRLRILAVAEEMGYHRNQLALAVKTGKSRTLGFLAGTAHMEYTSRFFSGVVDAAEERGYSIQRFRLSGEGQDRKAIVRCIEHRLAGVVVYDPDSRLSMDEMRLEFERHQLPSVFLDVKSAPVWGIGVASDDEMGARQAVEHLVELGHRRIVFSGGVENVGTGVPRFAGYKATMQEHGLERYIQAVWTNWSGNWLDPLLAQPEPPTAILCGSDPMALIALNHLQDAGKRVPEDISVVGFGDLLRTGLSRPALTTVSVPYEEVGREAVFTVLGEELAGYKPPKAGCKLIPTQLQVRRSTSRAPGL